MAKKRLMDKLFGFMGIEEEESAEVYEEESDDQPEEPDEAIPSKGKSQKNRVVNLHTQKQVKLIVAEPTSFDEVQGIADHVKAHRPVIINIENLDRELAKRMVDFLGGVTYALDGAMQKVGDGIFLLTPENFDVAGDIQSTFDGPNDFTWGR
jgi:cell division inhibitor SepF